jgi:MinD-like ATPase involved in chromosome partitioning or flagellar assembly
LLNAILFSPDPSLAMLVRNIAEQSSEFTVERLVDSQPTGLDIKRALGTGNPDVILLEVADPERDIAYAGAIHAAAPGFPIVALTAVDIGRPLALHPDCGISEVLAWPFDVAGFDQTMERAVHRVADSHTANLLAFLPGKAGSGASTTVMNTADMLAGPLRKHPLVIEGDLRSGSFATILDASPPYTIRHALREAQTLDAMEWERYLVRARGVDYVVTDTNLKAPAPAWSDYYHLLHFALPRYDLTLVDLPELVDTATAEAVRMARAVYVVTTPELPSLALTRQRLRDLQDWGVEDGRVFVIVTRWHKHALAAGDVETILQHPVAATVRNDHRVVQRAITQSGKLDTEVDAGADYLAFARSLVGEAANKPRPGRLSFLRPQ